MFTDRAALTTRGYADHRPLAARQAIYRWPLPDGSVEGALVMHMLYHVPDIAAAAAELRRVVVEGGVVLASANGRDDKLEIGRLWADAVEDLTGAAAEVRDPDGRFTLDDGDLLRGSFSSVEVAVFDRETLVPEVEPVVAFIDSMRGLGEDDLPGGVTWVAFLARVRERVRDEVERAGAFRIGNHVGVFTCS